MVCTRSAAAAAQCRDASFSSNRPANADRLLASSARANSFAVLPMACTSNGANFRASFVSNRPATTDRLFSSQFGPRQLGKNGAVFLPTAWTSKLAATLQYRDPSSASIRPAKPDRLWARPDRVLALGVLPIACNSSGANSRASFASNRPATTDRLFPGQYGPPQYGSFAVVVLPTAWTSRVAVAAQYREASFSPNRATTVDKPKVGTKSDGVLG